jgi:UDP-glucose 4-epimerase
MKRVGVTGAAGYIGSRVCYELKDSYDIVPIDNFCKGTIKRIGDRDVINADIRDKKTMESLFDVDCIIHLAAIPGVEACNKNRDLSYDINVNGTRVIAEICKKYTIPLIFASSFGAMGDPQYFPIDENHPRNPMHWYGKTKCEAENVLINLSHNSFPCYLFIKSNIYGVHVLHETIVSKPTVVNRFVDAAKLNDTLKIFKPGTQARNFLHVKDAAISYKLAVSHILKAENRAEFFCIASSESVSINELAENVVSIAKEYEFSPSVQIVENPRTETLVEDFSVNTLKAQKTLGFVPQYNIERAVRKMLEMENHL